MKDLFLCPRHLAGIKPEYDDQGEGFFENTGNRTQKKKDTYKNAPYPSINIYEGVENLYLTAELPGFGGSDIELVAEGQYVKIFGKRDSSPVEGRFLRVERHSGFFSRQIRIPYLIDAAGIKAHIDKGVLTITIPKPGAGNLRTIRLS